MVLVLDHLRSHVLESATKSVPLLHVVQLDAPPEVADLDYVAVLDEDVLWFDVSMNQTLLVQVVDAATDLDEEVESRVLRKELLPSDEIEQVSLGGVFQSQVNGLVVVKARIQSGDVFVVQLLLDPDLPDQSLLHLARVERRLLDLLDGH